MNLFNKLNSILKEYSEGNKISAYKKFKKIYLQSNKDIKLRYNLAVMQQELGLLAEAENNYKFLSRSELYCDYTQKKCPLIINNNKIYVDDGHLTNNGAKFFSNRGEKVIQKLLN